MPLLDQRFAHRLLDAFADDIELAFELPLVKAIPGDEYLTHDRFGLPGLNADGLAVDREGSPTKASDPFFGRGGKMLAVSQKEQKLKFEVVIPVISKENPTAVCSFNFHQEHFGDSFEIRTEDGKVANTACLGFGLERVVMALFKTHGFEPDNWPKATRDLLWP